MPQPVLFVDLTFRLEQFLQFVQFDILEQFWQLVQSVILEDCSHSSQLMQLLQNEQLIQSVQLEHCILW